jgi:ABC-type sugar transport system ATPase subunit
MEEIFQICDRVTVFKDGEFVIDSQIDDIDLKQLIKFMIGKDVSTEIRTDRSALNTEILAIENLNVDGILKDISLTLHSGEILGLAGLVGSGRTELLRAIFGDLKISQGSIVVDGKLISIGSCKIAIDEGIGLVPEDRKSQGLILNFSLRSNICMAVLGRLKKFGFISTKQENSVTQDLLNKLNVRHNSFNQKVNTLSGGNQQRVVLGKWLATRPKILLVDEPTRGVDVSAKAEIHKVLKELAKNGMGIIVVSSELSELLQITERILVICRGQLVANVETQTTNTQELMELSTGEKLTHMDKS